MKNCKTMIFIYFDQPLRKFLGDAADTRLRKSSPRANAAYRPALNSTYTNIFLCATPGSDDGVPCIVRPVCENKGNRKFLNAKSERFSNLDLYEKWITKNPF